MSNKRIIEVTSGVIFLILLFFVFYLIVIKPVITGHYIPSKQECAKAYDCDCLKDTCICTFKKWFWENRLSCNKDNINEKQLKR